MAKNLQAAKKFSIKDVPLQDILQQAEKGELQLPDFQRGWVWDDSHIVSLLASISLSYPIGAVMTLASGNPDVKFLPRLIEGVTLSSPEDPDFLLLDGQQRITSLYFALYSPKAVPTRDPRGKAIECHYYANINKCIDRSVDREDNGIVSIPKDKLITVHFGKKIILDLQDRPKEIAEEMFPLDIIFDPDETMNWQMDYIQNGPGETANRINKWKLFQKEIITPVISYQIPTIELSKATSKEAVCQVFEKVNTGGVSLTVFELLTATFAASNFNLREDWEYRSEEFDKYPILSRLESTHFLQIITLLVTYFQRMEHIDSTNPPAISCKRRDILKLTDKDYESYAESASNGLLRAVEFLRGEHIFSSKDVPYYTQLVPLATIFAVLGEEAENYIAQQKLRRWYWCGVFGEMYGATTETRFALDISDCVAWINDVAGEPRTVQDAQFQAERLLSLRTRISAAYKGIHALQMKNGARDFKTGNIIRDTTYFDNNVDIHHVFPKKWCLDNGIQDNVFNSIVNKTSISSHTNREMGKLAPKDYLQKMQQYINIPALNEILRSHDIEPYTLHQNNFQKFFYHRFERILARIERAMGKAVNRSAKDNPFTDQTIDYTHKIEELIMNGESKMIEFKSTGRKNLHTHQKDPAIEWSVVKSVAAFMNTDGGVLLVGVDDSGKSVGIEEDYPFVQKNQDGWEQWLITLIGQTLGEVEAAKMTIAYCKITDKTIAYIEVTPALKPVFAKSIKSARPKGDATSGREIFYVRTGNITKELIGNDLLDYQKGQWPN